MWYLTACLGLLLAACSSPAASPTTSAQTIDRPSARTAAPTAVPAPQGPIPDDQIAFLRDGKVVLLEMRSGREVLTGISGVRPIALMPSGDAMVAIGDTPDDIYTDEIVLQPLDGSPPTVLVESVPVGESGVLSPDGRYLVFASDGAAPNGLVLVDLERGEASQLTTDGGHSAVWSPGGTQIAYASVVDPALATDLHVIDLDSGVTRRLTGDEWEDDPFAWTPDGAAVLTTSHRGGDGTRLSMSVWQVDVQSGGLTERPDADVNQFALPSPDGRWVARFTDPGKLQITTPDETSWSVIDQVDIGVHLTWSPDGTWLIWSSFDDAAGTHDLFVVHAPDGEPIQLTRTPQGESHPVWGPIQHGF